MSQSLNIQIALKMQEMTVVTETHGPLLGKRVVRGYEHDCHRYYFK
mgnify:CR=1 FL=1